MVALLVSGGIGELATSSTFIGIIIITQRLHNLELIELRLGRKVKKRPKGFMG